VFIYFAFDHEILEPPRDYLGATMVGDGRAHLVGHVIHRVLPYQQRLLERHDGVLQLSWDCRVSLMGENFHQSHYKSRGLGLPHRNCS